MLAELDRLRASEADRTLRIDIREHKQSYGMSVGPSYQDRTVFIKSAEIGAEFGEQIKHLESQVNFNVSESSQSF